MLEDYCGSLTDEAQLKIAVRLCRLVLPVWSVYFTLNPEKLEDLNSMIGPENRVRGGDKRIESSSLAAALDAIEKSCLNSSGAGVNPLTLMRKDPVLKSFMATFMQPLTSSKWDELLPYSVRLAFTSVWNILTWLILRKKNDSNETHIYIAINQAADALMSEKILGVEEIDSILLEYSEEKRNTDESGQDEYPVSDEEGPAGEDGTPSDGEKQFPDEAYKKLLPGGENIVNNPPTLEQRIEILRQMREDGRIFWDQWYEYYNGISRTYSYNPGRRCYILSEVDVIVGSFFNEYEMSEESMHEMLSGISGYDLREDGFVF